MFQKFCRNALGTYALLPVLVVVVCAMLGGCPNRDPVANAGNDLNAVVGDRVTLSANASSDPDQQTLTFLWQQTGGPTVTLSSSTEATVRFTPAVAGTYTFTVTVTDTQNATSTDTIRVTVSDVSNSNDNSNTNTNTNTNTNDNSSGNEAPVANAGTDQTINESRTVHLDGSDSSDPDGDALSFLWEQTDGPDVTIRGATSEEASFVAPSVSATTRLTFRLTVTDENGAKATDFVRISVQNIDVAGVSPTIAVTTTALSTSVTAGANPAALTFRVRNSGGGTLRYQVAAATSSGGNWLSASPTTGTSTGEQDTITVTIRSSALAVGTFRGTLTISDPSATNQSVVVNVTLRVLAASNLLPTIQLDTNTLLVAGNGADAADPPDTTFVLTNTGVGALHFTVASNRSFIQVSPATGTLAPAASRTITVSFDDAAAQGLGTFTGTISVTDPLATNTPQQIAVTLRNDVTFEANLLANGPITTPGKLAIDTDDFLYVVDANNDFVYKFNTAGVVQMTIGTGSGSDPGEFEIPSGVAVAANGDIYVCDRGNNRVQRFDADGTFIRAWGTLGSGNGQLNHPSDIALDTLGNVYVADQDNERVVVFDPTGDFLDDWSTGSRCFGIFIDVDDKVYVATEDGGIERYDTTGENRAVITGADVRYSDIAVTSDGRIFGVASVSPFIREFNSAGVLINAWSTVGTGDGQIDAANALPTGPSLVFDSMNGAYVSDVRNGRIVRWTLP